MLMQLAVFCSLTVVTARKEIHATEVIITFWLLFGSLPSLSYRGILRFLTVTGIYATLLYSTFAAFGCWFWFVAADRLPPAPCPAIVFLGGTQLDGWFSKLGQAASVTGAAICAVWLVWDTGQMWKKAAVRYQVELRLIFSCSSSLLRLLSSLSLMSNI
jgi:hypothetical protein